MPDAGLGQAEGRELLAARLRDEPALALLLGPPLEERQRVQADVDALDDTERGVGTLELLAQDREADVVHPAAAVRLRDRGAQEPELAHPCEQLAVDLTRRVPVADVRQDLGLGERPRAVADELVLVGQREVDHGRHRTRPRSAAARCASLLVSRTSPAPSVVSIVAIVRLPALRYAASRTSTTRAPSSPGERVLGRASRREVDEVVDDPREAPFRQLGRDRDPDVVATGPEAPDELALEVDMDLSVVADRAHLDLEALVLVARGPATLPTPPFV